MERPPVALVAAIAGLGLCALATLDLLGYQGLLWALGLP